LIFILYVGTGQRVTIYEIHFLVILLFVPGVLRPFAEAENIPVEPDQDNACAGKVRVSLPLLSCFCELRFQ